MKNSKITELQYRDFSLGLHQKIGNKNKPIVGQMELTFRCNLKCVHCYVVEDKTKQELTFAEITHILDQIHEEGCLWLSFTGGEPLMRSDFLDIYHYAKNKGFLITLLTNATLITPEIADYLAKDPPFSIDITLNGITAETYEGISQAPGSFKKSREGIRLLLDRELPIRFKTKVTKLNHHELDRIKDWAESLGKELRPNAIIYPRLDGSLEPCGFRLPPEKIVALDNTSENCEEQEEQTEKSPSPPDKLFRCAAGISSFDISPYGELIFCTFMREPYFDLMKGSFKEGFYSLYPAMRSAKYQNHSRCKDCRIFYLCSQCPAAAYLENGNCEKPVNYFCQLAQRLAKNERD